MKKFILFPVIVWLCLIFSCASDDTVVEIDENANLYGTWVLTEVGTDPPLDLNDDGIFSSNLLEELPCLTVIATIKEDNSWTTKGTDVTVETDENGDYVFSCLAVSEDSGIWRVEENKIYFGEDLGDPTFFTIVGDQLILQMDKELPDFTRLVYTKL